MGLRKRMASLKRFVFGQKTPASAQTDGIVTASQRDKFIVPSGYAFTPSDVLSYITRAEQGDTRFLYAFMDEMVARDTHLMAELNKAKTALSGADVQILPYPIEFRQAKAKEAAKARAAAAKKFAPQPPGLAPPGKPAASFADAAQTDGAQTDGTKALPVQIADYIEQQLKAPHVRLDRAIGALANGIFKGVGGVEVIVEPGKADGGRERLKSLNPIPSQRFRFNPFGTELLLQLSGDPDDLVAVTDAGARIAVCITDGDKPSPARRGILRTCIAMWISRMYGPGWWLHFVEQFGSPMRIAKTASNDIDTINLLKAALEELGQSLYAVIPDTAKIELVEASARSLSLPPHQTLMDWNASEISKAILGATQTSQILSGAGSQASATVHMDVFKALTKARAIEIAATIREQIIMPLVERNFGPEAAAKFCPEIVLATDGKVDLATLGEFLSKIKAAGGGKAVPLSYINTTGDIPVPEEGEPTLDDAPDMSNVLPFPAGGASRGVPGAKPGAKNGPGGVGAQPENGDQKGGRAGATDGNFYSPDQSRDDHGRWDDGGSGTGSVAADLHAKIMASGGVTYQMDSGNSPMTGYSVSHEGAARDVQNLQPSDVAKYLMDNAAMLHDPTNHFGAWKNPNGSHTLDVSKVHWNEAAAVKHGIANRQDAYGDLAKYARGENGTINLPAHAPQRNRGALGSAFGHASEDDLDTATFTAEVEKAMQRAVKTAPRGAGEDIVAPVRAILDRGVKEHASLASILYQIKVRLGLAVEAPETQDLIASVIAEARFRGMQSAK